jgi:hypothetical protein
MRSAPRALALCILTVSAAVAADPLSIEPHDGVLVLRNGFVMSGRITLLGDTYLVSFGDSGEARLPCSAVEFECQSLDEAYRMKRDSLESDEAKLHLQLADWCMRHGLMARAADQLLIARVLEPDHAALQPLERRFQSLASLSTSAPQASHPVVQASHAAPVQAAPTSEVEPFLVQQFTVTIQPILLNRCATHACHGAGSSTAYRLLRPSLGQVATSRLTHRNLQATLAYVDRDQPESSQLITMARQPHGGVATAVFEDKTTTQLDLIASWVRKLGMRFPESGPKRRKEVRAPSEFSGGEARPSNFAHEAAISVPASPDAESEAASADPFDPEEFNRRFHGKR